MTGIVCLLALANNGSISNGASIFTTTNYNKLFTNYETMKLILLGCAVSTEVKEDVEIINVGFNLTTDEPGGKRYGATKNIPMVDAELYNKPYEEICYKVLVDMGKLMYRFRQFLPVGAENEDDITKQMRDLAIDGLAAFFSTGEWWSKKLCEVHDIKAGSMILDVASSEDYLIEKDIRVITKC